MEEHQTIDISKRPEVAELTGITSKYGLRKVLPGEPLVVGSTYYIDDRTGLYGSKYGFMIALAIFMVTEVGSVTSYYPSGVDGRLREDEYRVVCPLTHHTLRNSRHPETVEEILGIYEVPPEKIEPLKEEIKRIAEANRISHF